MRELLEEAFCGRDFLSGDEVKTGRNRVQAAEVIKRCVLMITLSKAVSGLPIQFVGLICWSTHS